MSILLLDLSEYMSNTAGVLMLTICGPMSSPPVFLWDRIVHPFSVLCLYLLTCVF